jgi:hypothetical protein
LQQCAGKILELEVVIDLKKVEHRITNKIFTWYVRARATPTMKRKKGITKSASVTPFHGEWLIDGHLPPA